MSLGSYSTAATTSLARRGGAQYDVRLRRRLLLCRRHKGVARDPAPLFRTNVEGLRHVLDAAVDADLRRFAFTSTIGIPAERRPATSN